MPRTPLIAGNWKMNTTLDEARVLVEALLPELNQVEGVEKVVCPPFISLTAVAELTRGSTIAVGAQNMYFEEKGAFTGEVSPLMLEGLCDYVILGHSERRSILGEEDTLVGQKVVAAINHRIKPILCVGENAEQREHGHAESVVVSQLRAALSGAPFDTGLVIAYEPVWAIGTGTPATGEAANHMCAVIRKELSGLYTDRHAEEVRILYGGSVTPQSIGEFMGQPQIDGGLVGGASLKAEDFITIIKAASQLTSAKEARQG